MHWKLWDSGGGRSDGTGGHPWPQVTPGDPRKYVSVRHVFQLRVVELLHHHIFAK